MSLPWTGRIFGVSENMQGFQFVVPHRYESPGRQKGRCFCVERSL